MSITVKASAREKAYAKKMYAKKNGNGLSPKQEALAWKFQHTSPTMKSINDAAKCFDFCMKLMKGEIDDEEFLEKTGHQPHTLRSAKK